MMLRLFLVCLVIACAKADASTWSSKDTPLEYPKTFSFRSGRSMRQNTFKLTLGFSGGGRRSMALTMFLLNTLDEVQRWDKQSEQYTGWAGASTWLYDAAEGVSGGSWGIAAYNNRKNANDWFDVNKDMCMFNLLTKVHPACGPILAAMKVLPQCDRFPIFKDQEKPAVLPEEPPQGKGEGLLDRLVKAASDATKPIQLGAGFPLQLVDCYMGLKNGKDTWLPIWQRWVRNYTGRWNKNGRLKGKDVRVFFSSFDNGTPNYKDWTQIMWSSPTLNGGLTAVGPLGTYKYTPGKSFVKDIDTWLAIGSAAVSVDLGKFGMGAPINIFCPVKDAVDMEIKHVDRRAQDAGADEMFLAHKLTHLGDAGFLLNNPIRVERADVLGEGSADKRPTVRVMIDAGADEDYGAEEIRRTVNYIRRFGRKDIRITNVCKGTVPCPEVSPVHLLELKNGLIIHLKANSAYFAERTMMMFPTSVMHWLPQEEKYFRSVMHEWVQKVAKFITSLRSDEYRPRWRSDGSLTTQSRDQLLRALEGLDDLRVRKNVEVAALDNIVESGTRDLLGLLEKTRPAHEPLQPVLEPLNLGLG